MLKDRSSIRCYQPCRPELKKGKIVTAEEAVRIIRDGDTVATDGFVGACFAEEIAIALEKHFLETGTPEI